MKCELLIVTFRRDFTYLEYCLKSIKKFASGFSGVTLLVPESDAVEALRICLATDVNNHTIRTGVEWEGKGMLWHMAQIMYADEWCSDADYIAHIDADCIFTESVTPDDYVRDGNPILRYEYFTKLGNRHSGAAQWQEPTQRCLPFPVLYETMRCHPGVFHRGLYETARNLMAKKTGKQCADYIKAQKNEFPQTFCEFVTLGNVAMREFPNRYNCVEQANDLVTPHNKLIQFWSHAPIDEKQKCWLSGTEVLLVPIEKIKQYGL